MHGIVPWGLVAAAIGFAAFAGWVAGYGFSGGMIGQFHRLREHRRRRRTGVLQRRGIPGAGRAQ